MSIINFWKLMDWSLVKLRLKSRQFLQDLENNSYEQQLRELGLFDLEKQRCRSGLISLYSHLQGDCSEVRVSLLCHVSRERMTGNGIKLCQGRFRLHIRKKKITERIIRHWNKLPRAVVESTSLQASVCGKMVLGWLWWFWADSWIRWS